MKPLISLVFLYWNAPTWTIASLESIIRYMTVPFEIIIVNNGSEEELNKEVMVKGKIINEMSNCTKAVMINNEKNLGVTKGFNIGLVDVNPKTSYISMYANDWVMTPKWDVNMIEAMESNPRHGMMTSCTNWGAGSMMTDRNNPADWKQQVHLEPTDDKFWEAVEMIADKQHQVKRVTPNRFVCMGFFVKKECYDDVGLFDERIQCANDVWFSRVAGVKGWLSMTCWNAYIQHGFHQSFKQINDPETYSYIKPLEAEDYKLINSDKRCNP